MQAISGETYDFQAKPKVVEPRSKYRQPDAEDDEGIVRGNTYAAIVTSKNTENLQEANKFFRPPQKKQTSVQPVAQKEYEPGTPEPVPGRRHVSLETEEFVEQLTDKPPEQEKDTQTDFYIDRPVVRLFMPKMNGTDKESQIWEGDLFDYDSEVQPILQVLIGKTLEQSRMEVLEEEELKIMKEQLKNFEQVRNAELAEMQKLEAKEKRLLEESDRRHLQHRKNKEQKEFLHQKLISRLIGKNYLKNLQPTVFNVMHDQGVFRNPLELALNTELMPWLLEETLGELLNIQAGQKEIHNVLKQVVSGNKGLHQQNIQDETDRRATVKEAQRQEEIRKKIAKQKRAAEKARKIEEERRAQLKAKVQQVLVSRGEVKTNLLTQNLSDMDYNDLQGPSVGLFGGFLGEVILLISALKQLPYDDLQEFLKHPENISNLVNYILVHVLKTGTIEIGVIQDIQEQLSAVNPDLKIENLSQNKTQVEHVYNLINNMYSSLYLRQILADKEELDLSHEVIFESIVSSVFKYASHADEASKFININPKAQQKIKFVPVKRRAGISQKGLCLMKPDLNVLPLNTKSSKAGQMEEVDGENRPIQPKVLAEAELVLQGTLFNLNSGDLSVLVQHPVAEIQLLEELIKQICSSVKSLEEHKFNILVQGYTVNSQLQKQILEKIHKDFPIFDMNQY